MTTSARPAVRPRAAAWLALLIAIAAPAAVATARDDDEKKPEKEQEPGAEKKAGEDGAKAEPPLTSEAKSPQAVFDKAVEFNAASNWGGMLLLRPPAHRRALAYKILLNARMAAHFGDDELKRGFEQIVGGSGIDPRWVHPDKVTEIVVKRAPKAELIRQADEALAKADPVKVYHAAYALLVKAGKIQSQLYKGKLGSVRETGEKATAQANGKALRFVKVDEFWYLDSL